MIIDLPSGLVKHTMTKTTSVRTKSIPIGIDLGPDDLLLDNYIGLGMHII